MPVELTASAKKKLPAALKAKAKRKKMGSLGTQKDARKKRVSALEAAKKATRRN